MIVIEDGGHHRGAHAPELSVGIGGRDHLGAKFVVELACYEPRLFKAVISGSGFYQMKVSELIKLLPVQFYFATSKNDKGIYEQGSPTGKMCARWCKNSRYVEYETRYHFWVELLDRTGRKNKDGTDETALDWIASVLK